MIQGEEYLGFVCRVRAAVMAGIRPVLKPRSQGASTMAVTELEELMFGLVAEAADKSTGSAETKNTPDEVLNELQKKEEQDALDRVGKESPVVS